MRVEKWGSGAGGPLSPYTTVLALSPAPFPPPQSPDLQSQPWDLYPQHQTFLLGKTHPFLPLRNHRAILG